MKAYRYILLNLFFTVALLSQEQNKTQLDIGQNYRLSPGNYNQYEVSIVVNPNNPNIIFASANTFLLSFISEGIYVTTDGGANWQGNDTCKGEPVTLHSGDPGIVIDKDGKFILTRKGFSAGIYSHYSTDNGITWSNQKIIANEDIAPERAGVVSDFSSSSSYFGRTYVLWVRISQVTPVIYVYTDDGAQTWSLPDTMFIPSQRSVGGELAIDQNGKLFSCWASVTEVSPFTEDFVGFASSSDGGNSWTVKENAFDMNGIAGQLTQKSNIRVNGLPRIAVDSTSGPRSGWIYIVTGQKNLSPAGSDEDIILNRSTDGGLTWSAGIRVNQDQLNNGKIQLFPAVHVDKYGGVNVIFFDDRNTTSDSSGVFLARTDDGGNTWQEFEISDHNFQPKPIAGVAQGKMGDNIGIISANDKLWPVWMDNSINEIYQIWTVPIEISTVGVNEPVQQPAEFSLSQNYPNPFNPSTTIMFSLKEESFVTLKFFDILGREIQTIINEVKPTGEHEVELSTVGHSGLSGIENLPSGIYFYQLKALPTGRQDGSFVQTKKMVLIR